MEEKLTEYAFFLLQESWRIVLFYKKNTQCHGNLLRALRLQLVIIANPVQFPSSQSLLHLLCFFLYANNTARYSAQ